VPPKPGDKVKRAHHVLNLQEKLELIKLSEQGMSHADIGRKLGVPRSSVSSILKVKDKVLEEIKIPTPMHIKHIRKRDSLIANIK
jgi:predicted XRE-type DNA-binding protein